MVSRVFSIAAVGLEAELITIEADNSPYGKVGVVIVGLGDTAVQEAKERVKTAVLASRYRFPRGRVVVSLAPADTRKFGPGFDLPIALAVLAKEGVIDQDVLHDSIFIGELGLNGDLRHVNGVLSLVQKAAELGFKRVFVSHVDANEASLVPHIQVYGVKTLKQIVDYFHDRGDLETAKAMDIQAYLDHREDEASVDMSLIKGQEYAKRALEITAAGGHNILMCGAPGSGKTLMARAMKGILPRMTLDEALAVTKIYSLSGLLPQGEPLVRTRPFRVVHHTASGVSIVGGGRIPKPGEVSLAHKGILFLDEMGEFPMPVLEVLRQPMEDKTITISRAQGTLSYPAAFILFGAMNPCPCGFYGVQNAKKVCECSPSIVKKYQSKISGPLMDRIDLYCEVSPVEYDKLSGDSLGESSEMIRTRVEVARKRQEDRFKGSSLSCNSEMGVKGVKKYCSVSSDVSDFLREAVERMDLSARAYHRILKLSRTISDIDERDEIGVGDVSEALQYRKRER
jgi:magnesium chelatase family protein